MSEEIQDLSSEQLLADLTRVQFEGRTVPALSGIPVLTKIGTGLAGNVYLGMTLPEHRKVAIKALYLSEDANPARQQRFLSDIREAASVSSNRLVELLDGGKHDGVFFLVMEYVPGVTLQQHLAALKVRLKMGLAEGSALDAITAVTDGLVAAHKSNVLHLDLKPSAIICPKLEDGNLDFANAKLADLGLGYNDYATKVLLGSAAQSGTPGFLSPEQAVGSQEIGRATDVFSTGATLYALLVGQPPFGGLSLDTVLSATVNQEAGGVRTWRPDVSRPTARLIEICLKKSPLERFPNAEVLLQALTICRQTMEADVTAQEEAVKQIDALVPPVDVKAKLLEKIFSPSASAAAAAAVAAAVPPPEPATPSRSQILAATPGSGATAPAVAVSDAAVASTVVGDASNAPTMVKFNPLDSQIISPSQPDMPAVSDEDEVEPAVAVQAPIVADETPDPALRAETVGQSKTDIFNDLLKKKFDNEGPADEAAGGEVVDKQEDAAALVPTLSTPEEENKSPKTMLLNTPAADEWVDPAVQQEQMESEFTPAPKKRGGGVLVAALLLIACGGAAYYLGYLDQWLKPEGPKPTVVAKNEGLAPPAVLPDATPAQPIPVKGTLPIIEDSPPVEPAVVATSVDEKTKAEQAKLAQERLGTEADTAKKAEEEKLAAAKKAEEKLAEEAKAAEAAKLNTDAEKQAAEKLAAEKKAEEEKLAAAAKKAEEEKLAALEREKAEKAAAAKEEEARKLAEETKAAAAKKAEEEKLAAAAAAKKAEEDKLAAARKADEEKAAALAAAKKAADEARAAELAIAKKDAEAKRLADEAKKKADAEKRSVATAPKVEPQPANVAVKTPEPANPPFNGPHDVTVDLGGGVTMDFVLVQSGSFTMGTNRADLAALCMAEGADTKDYQDESPARRMDMPAYYIQKTPVTVGQFKRFVAETSYKTGAERVGAAFVLQERKWQKVNGASWQNPGFEQKDDQPVVMISYRDSEAFAAWVAQVSGKAARIPSESEWEYAARGPQSLIWPWGNAWNGKLANHSDKRLKPYCVEDWNYSKIDDGFSFTSPVGSFKNRSWCGALDMAGNVFQWCADIYEPYPSSASAPQIVEANEDKDAKRVLRGGSFLFRPIDCRGAARRSLKPRTWSCELGMRLAWTPQ